MNINIQDINKAINHIIVIETKDSPHIQPISQNSTVLPIQIQELQELIQAQSQRSDELENRLNQLQLQQGSIRELQYKTIVLEARSKIHQDSFEQLEDNMRVVYDTLDNLKSYPNTIVKETNQTLSEVQQVFNDKYSQIINAQIQEIQQIEVETRSKQVI
jgi:hypothetical protein